MKPVQQLQSRGIRRMNARQFFFGRALFLNFLLATLALTLSACGGPSGSSSLVSERGKITLDVTRSALPLNVQGLNPSIGGPFTATLFVAAENDKGPIDGEFGCILLGDSVDRASLYYLDGSDRDTRTDPETGETILAAYRSITLESNSGGASFHLNAETRPGPVRVRCSITDPVTSDRLVAERSINIGSSLGSGDPTEILMLPREGVVFEQGLNRPTTDTVSAVVLDENRGAARDPAEGTNNVRVEILSGPNAGEYLVGRDAAGSLLRGNSLQLPTSGGVARFQVVSGFQSGTILVRATADQADNNVDNLIQNPVFGDLVLFVTSTGLGPPLDIVSPESLPAGAGFEPYIALLEATGGVPPYRWAVVGGALPSGLELSPSGVITGIPFATGESCFLARVQDSTSPQPAMATQRFCIDVGGEPLEVSLVGANTTLSPGASTNYSLVLNQPAPSATTVRLSVTGNSDRFTVPASVVISAGQSSANFTVSASPSVPLGASVQFSIVAGLGYTIGTPASATVTAGAGLVPQVRLIGGDKTLPPGTSTTYGLVLDQPASSPVRVNLARVGDISLFGVPTRVDIPAGQSSVNFTVTAEPNAAGGQIEMLIVPSSAYTVGTPSSARISGGPAVGPVVPVDSVILLSSSPQLPSVGTPPVTLTAFVRDANNALMEDVPVTFSADNEGTLLVTRAITDESGTAQAQLNTLASKENRIITATATAGGRSDSVEVRVVDTTISISGRNSGLIGDSITLTLRLRDSAGNPIAGAPLTVSFPGGNILDSANPTTDGSGRATVTLGLTVAGEHDVSVAGFGATATFTITVSPYSLRFVQPDPPPDERTEYPLNERNDVQVELQIDGVDAPDGTEIRFVATRGTFTGANPASTVDGLAGIEIESTTSGPAIITAVVESGVAAGTRAELEVLFVAERARSMTLQANPAVIGTNRQGETDEQSEIVAVLRDPIGNLVKGKTINFNLTDVTGGSLSPASAVTDVFGRATTTYTAGSTASAQNGIEVRAEVLNPDPQNLGFVLEESVQLTTSQKALFITLGTGDEIFKDVLRYRKPYGVLVTDSTGSPVANANVTIEIWPEAYYKGEWFFADPFWIQDVSAGPCLNEDVDRTGVFDPVLDVNGNGVLDPGTVVTLSTGTLVTDATGFADFDIVYFQEYAQWIDVELTARAVVVGSESTEQVFFRLPIAANDIIGLPGPAGNPSPFGTANACANPN